MQHYKLICVQEQEEVLIERSQDTCRTDIDIHPWCWAVAVMNLTFHSNDRMTLLCTTHTIQPKNTALDGARTVPFLLSATIITW